MPPICQLVSGTCSINYAHGTPCRKVKVAICSRQDDSIRSLSDFVVCDPLVFVMSFVTLNVLTETSHQIRHSTVKHVS